MEELNPKQEQFVKEYLVDFNGKQAAIRAGYSPKSAEIKASDLLRIVKVKKAVEKGKAKQEEERKGRIATRQERQEFWTQTMKDLGVPVKDRLKASELLGKSEGDFTERQEHTITTVSIKQIVEAARADRGLK